MNQPSVQFSHSVVSDSLQPHGLQHPRPPSPSPTPGAYSNSCSLSQWCHPTISSSVVPVSSYLQSFPTSGSFQMSQLFVSGGQSIGVSASASVLPMNMQDLFPLGWTIWISLLSKGLSRVFSNTTVQKASITPLIICLWTKQMETNPCPAIPTLCLYNWICSIMYLLAPDVFREPLWFQQNNFKKYNSL